MSGMGTGVDSLGQTSEKASLSNRRAESVARSERVASTVSRAVSAEEVEVRGVVRYGKLPWGIWLLENFGLCCIPKRSYKLLVFVLTFCCYTSYHLSRKPISVVKVSFCPVCANCSISGSTSYSDVEDYSYLGDDHHHNYTVTPGWAPFNGRNGNTLLGVLDYSWLFSYAIAMYFSGAISDRINLRYFLTFGMIGSGISVCLLGVAYFADIHKLYYFIIVQIFGGALQSTGWPGVVAVMSQWFGKQNRGLIMGVWNSHVSVGNILGTIIPSFWADCDDDDVWAWSFLIPGFIIIFFGIVTFLFLVPKPDLVGVPSPVHHLQEDLEVEHTVYASPSLSLSDDKERVKNVLNTTSASLNDKSLLVTSAHEASNTKAERPKAINFLRALTIPGVVEYALALFFNKLVSYTFLYWLPLYVKYTNPSLSGPQSDWLSTLYDVGGIIGGILAGVVSDRLNARAITCVVMLLLAVPSLFVFRAFGSESLAVYIVLLVVNGTLINGPYGVITTAVSSDLFPGRSWGGIIHFFNGEKLKDKGNVFDRHSLGILLNTGIIVILEQLFHLAHQQQLLSLVLLTNELSLSKKGTHPSLKSNQNAKATVTAIIDGTGSLGAAVGPLLIGVITRNNQDWTPAFYMLMTSCFISALFLSRLVGTDIKNIFNRIKATGKNYSSV